MNRLYGQNFGNKNASESEQGSCFGSVCVIMKKIKMEVDMNRNTKKGIKSRIENPLPYYGIYTNERRSENSLRS